MTKMSRFGAVLAAPDDPPVLSRLMVHGFTQVDDSTPVTGVEVEDSNGKTSSILDGLAMSELIAEGCRFLPAGAPESPAVNDNPANTEE